MKILSLSAVMALALSSAALAVEANKGDVRIEHPWARASAGNAPNGAAFMTVVNAGAAPDRLLAAATPAADKAELHNHVMDQGVMRMRRIEAIDVDPGASIQMRPGGMHVMLMGLKAPLKSGTTVPVTLTFEKAGQVAVEATVLDPGSMGPMPMAGHSHH